MEKPYGGFTIVELLVVITIIALLISLLSPVLSQARENARRAICLAQERSIGIASFTFTNDYNGYLPGGADHAGRWNGYDGGTGGPSDPVLPGISDFALPRLFTGIWDGKPCFGYINDIKQMCCPSRYDHYSASIAGGPYIGTKAWNNFYSTYHYTGGSGVVPNAALTMYWYYKTRAELQSSNESLLFDMVNNDELGSDWIWLKQNNHWLNSQPQGANILGMDGSGKWKNYASADWYRGGNVCIPNNTYYVWLSPVPWDPISPQTVTYYFSDPGTNLGARRGVLVTQ